MLYLRTLTSTDGFPPKLRVDVVSVLKFEIFAINFDASMTVGIETVSQSSAQTCTAPDVTCTDKVSVAGTSSVVQSFLTHIRTLSYWTVMTAD
jgi:hypothetical protein